MRQTKTSDKLNHLIAAHLLEIKKYGRAQINAYDDVWFLFFSITDANWICNEKSVEFPLNNFRFKERKSQSFSIFK